MATQRPHLCSTIDSVRITPGQTLTVWLVTNPVDASATQVELRVLPDGRPEIFSTAPENIKFQSFDFHTPMPEKR